MHRSLFNSTIGIENNLPERFIAKNLSFFITSTRKEFLYMHEIKVRLPSGSYKIQIEAGTLGRCGDQIRAVSAAERVVVISDENVWSLYGSQLEAALVNAGFLVDSILIPPGESSKTMECFARVCGNMADLHVQRDHLIIAFGGGVVGDLAGFAAAVYMRGLPYVQIPTTLLAQVDSSVGGKTAIDLPQGKNLVGAFHQPQMVLTDPDLLKTLDRRHLAEGMAEIIKYGAISDEELFVKLEEYGSIEGALPHMEDIIFHCCDTKRVFVEQDERDGGERQKLNFGHSFGHAIEKMGQYREHSHGEAVALGMVMAAKTGEALGLTPIGTGERLKRIIQAYQLPTEINVEYKELVHHMSMDKKNDHGGHKLILLKAMGKSMIYTVAEAELSTILEDILELAL